MIFKSAMVLIFALSFCWGILTNPVSAQTAREKFPDRPITLIVNFGAGGATDVAVRPLAKAAEKELGVPILIMNKPGGNATIGITELSRAKPDGYTIGVLTMAPMCITPFLQKVPYDDANGFDFRLGFARYRYALVLRSDSPYKAVRDLVQAAREHPKKVSYASTDYANNLVAAMVERKEGIRFARVPFETGPAGVAAVLGKHVDFVIVNPPAFRPFLEAKEVKALAVASSERWPMMPEVPTMKEVGYDMDISSWMSLGTPVGVPADRLRVLRDAFKKAYGDQTYQSLLNQLDLFAPYTTGDEVKSFFNKKRTEFKPLIETLQVK